MVNMRIIGRSVGALNPDASMTDAESWFAGQLVLPNRLSDSITEVADREAVKVLELISYDRTLQDLLPYVLDTYGPGSRASIRKDPRTQHSRRAKRASGVFYTPSDVADYVTREAIVDVEEDIEALGILDPACGTGVFLRAALDYALNHKPEIRPLEFIENCLHGIDINPLAVDAACFVLLHECMASKSPPRFVPWCTWHRIRCNLHAADSLMFQLSEYRRERSRGLLFLRKNLSRSYLPPCRPRLETECDAGPFSQGVALGEIFPSLSCGADVIVGNPPYARIGNRHDAAFLKQKFSSLCGSKLATSNLFPLFLEMMWQLVRPDRNSSGMVVPLSLAFSGRPQMRAFRHSIVDGGGHWRFAFFDREPHALFGEDVKTRNAIVFRHAIGGEPASMGTVQTGPLRKWSSRERAQLFDRIDFTPVSRTAVVERIPKLGGKEAVNAYHQILSHATSLSEMSTFMVSCRPESATLEGFENCVFVASTAYNFLNVFRRHRGLPASCIPWSASRIVAVGLANEETAQSVFAILSSRVAFWLWHVEEDGFHVTKSFLERLPFSGSILSSRHMTQLGRLGGGLWEDVQTERGISVNGGHKTVSYRPHESGAIVDRIDSILLGAAGVADAFSGYLRSFVRLVGGRHRKPGMNRADRNGRFREVV